MSSTGITRPSSIVALVGMSAVAVLAILNAILLSPPIISERVTSVTTTFGVNLLRLEIEATFSEPYFCFTYSYTLSLPEGAKSVSTSGKLFL